MSKVAGLQGFSPFKSHIEKNISYRLDIAFNPATLQRVASQREKKGVAGFRRELRGEKAR